MLLESQSWIGQGSKVTKKHHKICPCDLCAISLSHMMANGFDAEQTEIDFH